MEKIETHMQDTQKKKKENTNSADTAVAMFEALSLLLILVVILPGCITHTTDTETLAVIFSDTILWLFLITFVLAFVLEYENTYLTMFPLFAGVIHWAAIAELSPVRNAKTALDTLAVENSHFIDCVKAVLCLAVLLMAVLLAVDRKRFAKAVVMTAVLSAYLATVSLTVADGISVYIEKKQEWLAEWDRNSETFENGGYIPCDGRSTGYTIGKDIYIYNTRWDYVVTEKETATDTVTAKYAVKDRYTYIFLMDGDNTAVVDRTGLTINGIDRADGTHIADYIDYCSYRKTAGY